MVAHIRHLAVSRERGSEGCVVHAAMRRMSWASIVHMFLRGRALNPSHELPCTQSKWLLHLFYTFTISVNFRIVASHQYCAQAHTESYHTESSGR